MRSRPRRFLSAFLPALVAICISSVPTLAAPSPVDEVLASIEGLSFDDFVNACYREIMLRDPDTLWSAGIADAFGLERFDEWTDLSLEAVEETQRLDLALLEKLQSFDRASLSSLQQLEYDAHEWYLEDRIRFHAFPYWDLAAIGPSSYGVHNQAIDLLVLLPIETVEDAEDYVARLEGTSTWMEQLIAAMQLREDAGAVPTEIAISFTLSGLDSWLVDAPAMTLATQLDVYTTFSERLRTVDGLGSSERIELLQSAKEAIASSLIPAFRSFRDYVATLANHPGAAGVADHDQHEAYYDALLQHHTTLQISPADVVSMAEAEIARLQEEMRSMGAASFGWPETISMADLDGRLTAINVPVLQGNDLRVEYERLIAEATAAMPTVFELLPPYDVVVVVELDGAPAYYREGAVGTSDPGKMPTSLVNVVPFMAYDEPVLMHHETNPGHHYQLSLERDLELSLLRRYKTTNYAFRHPVFQAFIEGWALYSEPLAHEMGLYDEDPVGALCQKRLELVRTARVIADVGMNDLGWSWDDAAAYIYETTGRAESATGILRYDVYPAQSCAYTIGYLTFLNLRRQAEEELGDAFDLKGFHRVLVEQGNLPMSTVERLVEAWIEEMRT